MTKRFKLTRWLFVLIVFMVILMVINLNTGQMRISPSAIWNLLAGKGTYTQSLVIFDFRMPRIVVTLLVGFALAIAGNVIQSTTQNPMADTSFLGINSGAGIAVMLFIALVKNQDANLFLLPTMALVGALISTVIVFGFSYKKETGITSNRMLLTGVALSGLYSSIMVLLTLKLLPENYQFVMNWLAGSIWGTSWEFILIAAAVILAGVSVSISGGIGFIGLITPNLSRRVIGFKHSHQLVLSGVLGSFLLLAADTVGKVISSTTEIPVGILVAVIGAPYFVYILMKTK